jgi:fatty acid desaturase
MSTHHQKSITAENLLRIRAALPAAAFQPDPSKLVGMGLHTVIFFAAHAAVARLGLSGWLVVPIAIAAASLSCIGFHTHDLAHGSILRPGRAQRLAELFFWGLLMIAPTVWRRVHNQSHHVHYNTSADPDRRFLAEEACPATRWYVRLLYPNAEVFPWNPLVFVHFVPYVVRNTFAALLPARWKPAVVPNRPDYAPRETAVIVVELLALASLQAGLFLLTGGRLVPYLIMAAGTQCVTSCITMSYIFTNHFINPLTAEPDPIQGTTSVIVPRWLDRLHANFSYHTEHHLFPGLNSDYYPALSRILAGAYPDSYHRIPIRAAWRRLWRNQPFAERPAPVSS